MNNLLETLRRERESDDDSIESTAYHQKPKELRFCLDCESVYKNNKDYNNQCPSCTSHVFMPLSFFVMEKFKGINRKKKLKNYLVKWIHKGSWSRNMQAESERITDLIREITRRAVSYGFTVDPKLNPNRPAGFPITYEELVSHPAKAGYYNVSKWMSEILSVWDWQKFVRNLDFFLEDTNRLTTTYVEGLLSGPSVSSRENSRALLRAINKVLLDPAHGLTVPDRIEDRG